MKPYALKWIKKVMLFIGLTHLILWLFLGLTSFLTTLTIYILVGLLGLFSLKRMASKKSLRENLSLFWLVSLLGCLLLEGTVRYVFKWHLSYQERTGLFMSSSIRNVGSYDSLLQDSMQAFNSGHQVVHKRIEALTYHFTTNSLGLRGPEPDFQNGELNFITLGDSYTEGYGAKDDSTWPALLAQKISASTGKAANYINAGVSGSDPFTQFNSLQWLLKRYSPDLVILCINSSDLYEYTYRSGGIGWKEKTWERFYNVSFLWRVFVREVLHRDALFQTTALQEQKDLKAQKALAQVIAQAYYPLLEGSNIKFIAVAIPSQWELQKGVSAFTVLESNVKNSGVIFRDLFNSFQMHIVEEESRFHRFYYPSDGHFKPEANALLADFILEVLLP